MIKKILIANRGEIALRIIKTCKLLNIQTVTIYATDDANLLHATSGDENIHIGRGPLSETYLNQEKIIKLAKDLNVDAIHPGYGFLSENADFCQKLKDNDLIFIGPNLSAIKLMGDKKTSKVKMEEIGIPLVPGYHGDNQDEDFLAKEAIKIGFPVLIKATAGGGGKGMRIVHHESEFKSALTSSKREALNAFSNDKVLLEKYIINPRHIEVQLMSDGKGNHFHFFERECSIQRRYQKVIEETPCLLLDDKLRSDICATAVKIAKEINYIGAGTIEFIMGPDMKFYFLEMNTRLQVEHPVTEMVTGYDLVELQIEAANGEAFDFKQEDIFQSGHAIECRIYAEDPDNDFLPTNGRIQKVQGEGLKDYRLDCGYKDGNSISTSYDPMLAKVIVWEEDRYLAIEKMQDALNDTLFSGVKTNRDYLKRVLFNDKFIEGDIHTHFIENEKNDLIKSELSSLEAANFIAAALIFEKNDAHDIWGYKTEKYEKKVLVNNIEFDIEVTKFSDQVMTFQFLGFEFNFKTIYKDLNELILEGESGEIHHCYKSLFNKHKLLQMFINDEEAYVEVIPKAKPSSNVQHLSEGSLQSPMPGKIFKIHLKTGAKVKKGEAVLIVEAMKMEHTIKAPKDGIIKEIFFKEGDQVQGGVLLCEIE